MAPWHMGHGSAVVYLDGWHRVACVCVCVGGFVDDGTAKGTAGAEPNFNGYSEHLLGLP